MHVLNAPGTRFNRVPIATSHLRDHELPRRITPINYLTIRALDESPGVSISFETPTRQSNHPINRRFESKGPPNGLKGDASTKDWKCCLV